MPEIEHKITWYFILRTNIGSVKIGEHYTFLYVESLDKHSHKDVALEERFNNLSFDKRCHFLSSVDDDYDPQRDVSERAVRSRISDLGWFDEFELEYLLSSPNERYIGPGTKEWEEWEKFKAEADRDPGIHLSHHFSGR